MWKTRRRVCDACLAVLMVLLAAAAGAEENGRNAEVQALLEVTETPPSPEDPGAVVITLENAQDRALEENPGLQAVAELVEQARQGIRMAFSAYLPQVNASYSASHTELSDATVATARQSAAIQARLLGRDPWLAQRAVDSGTDQYRLSLTAQYLLFDGLGRKFQYDEAKLGKKESEAGLMEARRQMLQAVAQRYYGVQLARENIAIALADEVFNRRLLVEAKAQRREGAGSLSNELNFEVLYRASRSQLLSAKRDYEVARIALATLMGLPEGQLDDSARVAALPLETEEDLALPEEEALAAAALEQRPDLARSGYALQRARAALKGEYASFSPSVGAFISYDGQDSDSNLSGEDFSQTVGLSVSYDIFTGGRRWAQVVAAKHARREAAWRLDEAELAAISDVRSALSDLRTAQEQVLLQRDAAAYVEKNRDLVKKEYDAGQAPLAQLNQAQKNMVEAQGRLALARVSLRSAWYAIRTATGETVAALEQGE